MHLVGDKQIKLDAPPSDVFDTVLTYTLRRPNN
jgi:hypothetical protein